MQLHVRLFNIPKLTKNRPNDDFKRPSGVIGYGNNMRVAHTVKIKSLTNLVPSTISPTVNDIIDVKKVKKNKQSKYKVHKKYKLGKWKDAFEKAKKKATDEDNAQYKEVPSEDY